MAIRFEDELTITPTFHFTKRPYDSYRFRLFMAPVACVLTLGAPGLAWAGEKTAVVEPSAPELTPPKPLLPGDAGMRDFRRTDAASLERFNAVFEADKSRASPDDKALLWGRLAYGVPAFEDFAVKRSQAWRDFAKARKGARKRLDARDAEWDKLRRLLALAAASDADKRKWSEEFLAAYEKSPGLEMEMAAGLAPFAAAEQRRKLEEFARSASAAALANSKKAGIHWVDIAGGSFLMGGESDTTAKPVHRVEVKAFQIAKTEVTNKQYRACVEAGVCDPPHNMRGLCDLEDGVWMEGDPDPPDLPEALRTDDRPVVCVDWEQARTFARWVGGRLPSEAEWEYAARSAGKDRRYPWGNEEIPVMHPETICERAVAPGCADETAPVCSKPYGNTEQGLCDMAGNVSEWVQDWYHDTYNGAPADASAWEAPPDKFPSRVVRGAAWRGNTDQDRSVTLMFEGVFATRTFARSYHSPEGRNRSLGLRPAR